MWRTRLGAETGFVCLLKRVRHGLGPQSAHRPVLFAAPVIVCIECYNEGTRTGEDELEESWRR